MKENKQIKVLLVDDDKEDIELTLEVLRLAKLKIEISLAYDGVEAMDLLTNNAVNDPQLLPDLVLLDLNMPRKGGHEVLEEMKRHPLLKKIPVVILTTSKAELDISKSYNNGVNCYVTKPVGLNEFQKVVEAVNSFWFTVVKFPEK